MSMSTCVRTKRDVEIVLGERILALIQLHPEITERIPSCLLDYPEFEFRDLNPMMFEVICAFNTAVLKWKAQQDLEKP